jgi:hypothetical protein
MKKTFTFFGIVAVFITGIAVSSCKKSDPAVARPKEQLIAGKWSINRVQLKGYVGGTLIKDSIVPNAPQPENFVKFDGAGGVEYRFNKSTSDFGTYSFVGTSDSVVAVISGVTYRWKNLLLTETNFNVVNTTPFSMIPGSTVDTYQVFVR